MFGSTVLEVALGLTFCYAALALIVSTLQEALASALHMRARTLLDGVKSMLNDPRFEALARAVYAHALVNPHEDLAGGARQAIRTKPAYIEPLHFAIALVDAIQTRPGDYVQLGRDIDLLADAQIRRALQGMHQRAEGDMETFLTEVAGWFDSAMVRVTSIYKRRSMVVSLLLSLLLAALFNIDSLHLFRVLWQQPMLTLPIGWRSFPPLLDHQFGLSVAGWLMTASTALFGAPFWFDLMKRTVKIRGD